MAPRFGDRNSPLCFPDTALQRFPHACAFFNGVEEQYAFTVPFLKFYMDPEQFLEELAGREDLEAGGRAS